MTRTGWEQIRLQIAANVYLAEEFSAIFNFYHYGCIPLVVPGLDIVLLTRVHQLFLYIFSFEEYIYRAL